MRLHNATTRWLTFLIAGGALSGCVSQPVNPWERIEASQEPAARSVSAPDWPSPASATSDSATFTLEQVRTLEAIRVASEANVALVDAHAATIDKLNDAVGYLSDAGEQERYISDRRAQHLEDERRHFFFERLGYWAIMLGLIGATL